MQFAKRIILFVFALRTDLYRIGQRVVTDAESNCLANVPQLALVVAVNGVGFDLHLLTVDEDFLTGLLRRECGSCRRVCDGCSEYDAGGDHRNFFCSVLHGLALL